MGHLNGVFAADDGSIYYVFTFVPAGDQQAVRMQMADAASKTFFQAMLPITLIFVAMKICIAVLSAMFRLLLLHPVLIKNVGSYLNDRGAT